MTIHDVRIQNICGNMRVDIVGSDTGHIEGVLRDMTVTTDHQT